MRKFFFHLILFLLILSSCSSQKQIRELPAQTPSPEWLTNRPAGGMYYIGIGQASKASGSDYQATAKKNALNDLASEIEVNVSSNSLLYTLEREYQFTEEFTESIKTTTNLDLSDYEMADTWQDENTYWVYYRLDKDMYASKVATEKENAIARAKTLYQLGRESTEKLDFFRASQYFLEALQNLEKYWGDPNPTQVEGKTVFLNNEIYFALKNLFADVSILSSPSAGVILDYYNRYQKDVEVQTISKTKQLPFVQVPLVYEYYGQYGKQTGQQSIPESGKLTIKVVEADKENLRNTLNIRIDTGKILEAFSGDKFILKLAQSLSADENVLPIQVNYPVVYMASSEKNMGQAMESTPVGTALSNSLMKKGIRFTDNSEKADLVINLNAQTKKGNEADGFFISYLQVNITVQDQSTGETAFSDNKFNTKGVSVNFEKAGEKAYDNFLKDLELGLSKPIIKALL